MERDTTCDEAKRDDSFRNTVVRRGVARTNDANVAPESIHVRLVRYTVCFRRKAVHALAHVERHSWAGDARPVRRDRILDPLGPELSLKFRWRRDKVVVYDKVCVCEAARNDSDLVVEEDASWDSARCKRGAPIRREPRVACSLARI